MIKLAVPYCLILICLLFSQRSSAQSIDTSKFKYLEVGIGMMAVNYSGDLAENHIIPEQTSFGANIFARYHLSKLIQLRGNLGVSYLHGDDKHSPTHAWRSFKFTNTVIDVGAYLELNILRIPFEPIGPTNRSYLMAYGLVGPSLVFSKPTAEYDGLPYNPNIDSGFPGEGNDKRTYVSYCYGGGIRYLYRSRYSIGLEATIHPTNNDWLDGVSTYTGDPSENDLYFKGGITFAYFIGRAYQTKYR